jgi:hypothetical protein
MRDVSTRDERSSAIPCPRCWTDEEGGLKASARREGANWPCSCSPHCNKWRALASGARPPDPATCHDGGTSAERIGRHEHEADDGESEEDGGRHEHEAVDGESGEDGRSHRRNRGGEGSTAA